MAQPAPTASPLVRRYDLDEFLALETPEHGGHWELIAGVLYMVPPPRPPHGLVVSRLVSALVGWEHAHPGRCRVFVPRESLWRRQPATYLEPDLFLVTQARVAAAGDEGFDAADLVVEVLSPTTAVYDRTAKADTYAALGVTELWLVDPDARTIEQRIAGAGGWTARVTLADGETVHSVAFPGLALPVAAAFADLSRPS